MTDYPGDAAPWWRRMLWTLASGITAVPDQTNTPEPESLRASLIRLAQQRIDHPSLRQRDRAILRVSSLAGLGIVVTTLALYMLAGGEVWYVIGGVYAAITVAVVVFQVALIIWVDGYITATKSGRDT